MVWLLKKRWRKVIYTGLVAEKLRRKILYRGAALIIAQKICRGYLANRKYRPKIVVRRRITSIDEQLAMVNQICAKLKKDKDKFAK